MGLGPSEEVRGSSWAGSEEPRVLEGEQAQGAMTHQMGR